MDLNAVDARDCGGHRWLNLLTASGNGSKILKSSKDHQGSGGYPVNNSTNTVALLLISSLKRSIPKKMSTSSQYMSYKRSEDLGSQTA